MTCAHSLLYTMTDCRTKMMEHQKAMTSDRMSNDSNNNNNFPNCHHRRNRKTVKQQPSVSLSLSEQRQVTSASNTDPSVRQKPIHVTIQQQQQQTSMKNSLSWKERWSLWFSSCSSGKTAYARFDPTTVSAGVRCCSFCVYAFNNDTCCLKVIDYLIQHYYFSFF